MRVTEGRLFELAAAGVSDARERAAAAGQRMQSGVRVELPSSDGTAWAEGARARAHLVESEARGRAIARSRERLVDTERALTAVGDVLARARELGVQGANATLSAEQRTALAGEIRTLRDALLAAADGRSPDGEWLLAGSRGDAAPFDAAGTYLGDSVVREIEVGPGERQAGSLAGDALTGVVAALDSLEAALAANDPAATSAALGPLATAHDQVAEARATVGIRMAALDRADEARGELEQTLAERRARAVETDPITAASELAESAVGLEAARAAAEEIIALVRRR